MTTKTNHKAKQVTAQDVAMVLSAVLSAAKSTREAWAKSHKDGSPMPPVAHMLCDSEPEGEMHVIECGCGNPDCANPAIMQAVLMLPTSMSECAMAMKECGVQEFTAGVNVALKDVPLDLLSEDEFRTLVGKLAQTYMEWRGWDEKDIWGLVMRTRARQWKAQACILVSEARFAVVQKDGEMTAADLPDKGTSEYERLGWTDGLVITVESKVSDNQMRLLPFTQTGDTLAWGEEQTQAGGVWAGRLSGVLP